MGALTLEVGLIEELTQSVMSNLTVTQLRPHYLRYFTWLLSQMQRHSESGFTCSLIRPTSALIFRETRVECLSVLNTVLVLVHYVIATGV